MTGNPYLLGFQVRGVFVIKIREYAEWSLDQCIVKVMTSGMENLCLKL